MRHRAVISTVVVLLVCLIAAHFVWRWSVDRIYVPGGHSLRLRYKGPPLPLLPGKKPQAQPGFLARVSDSGRPLEIGILDQLVGPGRHFYNPLWWERKIIPDEVIHPGEVAIVVSKLGNELERGAFLVDGDLGENQSKGIMRRLLGPGRYRINDYAYEVRRISREEIQSGNQLKAAGWVDIKAGYVGVVTNLAPNPLTGADKGIQENVLPPGLYMINPREQEVDVVKVGFRESSIVANLKLDDQGRPIMDPSGEPTVADDDSGISFPSSDGFPIHMDFTAIWGVMPHQAPEVIRKFGNVDAVETKVVLPQVESICRNMGSSLGAVDLLVGESRQAFQLNVSKNFEGVMSEKGLTLLYGLVSHIYIPQEVRLPIQQAFLADEIKLTLDQKQLTKRTEALLREAEQTVELEAERIRVETLKKVAERLAEGKRTAEETRAHTVQRVAEIEKQTAELDAQAIVKLGEAEANARKMLAEATAQKFQLAVEAFGSGQAYTRWVFANGLPHDVELRTLYAGPGTFWTDLRNFSDIMLGRQEQQYESTAAP